MPVSYGPGFRWGIHRPPLFCRMPASTGLPFTVTVNGSSRLEQENSYALARRGVAIFLKLRLAALRAKDPLSG
jgi:hypothetical protein